MKIVRPLSENGERTMAWLNFFREIAGTPKKLVVQVWYPIQAYSRKTKNAFE